MKYLQMFIGLTVLQQFAVGTAQRSIIDVCLFVCLLVQLIYEQQLSLCCSHVIIGLLTRETTREGRRTSRNISELCLNLFDGAKYTA